MSTTRSPGSSRWSCSQPVSTRGSSRVSTLLLLSEEVVFAGEGLGEHAGAIAVVLGEAALYHLALEKVLEGLDPTPRRLADQLLGVVALDGVCEPLYGVLGSHPVYGPFEALPGRDGDVAPPGGAAGYVGAGGPQESIDCGEHPPAPLEVGVPHEA